MRDLTCHDVAALAPELALGTLDAQDRAAAMSHLGGCPQCQRDLKGYTDVADDLLDLVPATEPPAGFETRVLSGIRADRAREAAAARPTRMRLRGAGRRNTLAAAAAALVLAVGLAGYTLGHRGNGDGTLQRATLTAAGHPVGEAFLYRGAHPWIYMGVTLAAADSTLTCELVHDGRPVATVGTFALTYGNGSWGAQAPLTSGVTGARLVDRAGVTVAEGSFGT